MQREMTQLRGEWDLHLVQGEGGYNQLKEDTAVSKSDPNVDVLTFNLQQSLPTLVLSKNVVFFYYKCQLWKHNLGVHNCGTGVIYAALA